MKINLEGQTAAITGAAQGIGRAIAESFLEAGSHILAIDIDAAALSDFQKTAPEKIETVTADVGNYAVLKGIAGGKKINHLVCAAAIGSGKSGFPFWNLEPGDWGKVIKITLMGTVNTVHAFAPSLLADADETQQKSVLLLASVAGQIGSQTDPPYSASKAAVINFAQCAAKDFAAHGIRVNAMSPGMVKTAMNHSVYQTMPASSDQSYEEWGSEKTANVSPLARWQEPEELGAMAIFLASDHGRNITGQTINIDGGQVMHS